MESGLALEVILVVLQSAFVLVLLALVIKLITIAISNGFHSPYLATPHKYLPAIADTLQIGAGDVVYDLGCGDGRLMLFCAKQYPYARFVGIERNPLLVAYARIRARMAGQPSNLSFKCEDFFKTNLEKATRLYVYLLPSTLNRLFLPETHGTKRLVSRAYKLTDRTPLATVELSSTQGTHGEHLLHVYTV